MRFWTWSCACTLWIAIDSLAVRAEVLTPIADTPFWQEYREPFAPLPTREANDQRAVAVGAGGEVFVATQAGLRRKSGAGWDEPIALDGPAFDVTFDSQQQLWIAAWDGLHRLAGDTHQRVVEAEGPIAKVVFSDNRIWAAGPRGIWRQRGAAWERVAGKWASSIRDLLSWQGELWVATSMGLYRVADDGATQRWAQADELLSGDVRALAVEPEGQRLWVGSTGGIDVIEAVSGEPKRVRSITPAEGLPCREIHALAFADDGTLWAGTALGVARWDGRRWSLRHSQRWLPHDDVRDLQPHKGQAFAATAGGLGQLARKQMTLADKAAHYHQLLRQRHVRPPGLVEKCLLPEPGSVRQHAPVDTDNDGSFTAMYLAAESFRYAVTGEPEARRHAAEAFAALEFLQTVTGTTGFVARTVIPADWTRMDDPNRRYSPQENAVLWIDEPNWKPVEIRWRPSADGRWLWKGDTSSDEITGHYLGFCAYFDLAADEAERRRVAALVDRVTDYLIEGGYDLRDTDGQPTRWGIWSPRRLNDDPDWELERGVNSIELLAFFQIARHVTGDEKYARAAADLIDNHHYAENSRRPQTEDPATFTHIDSELLAHVYPWLLRHERDPRRKATYIAGVERWFALNRRDRSPYYQFAYLLSRGAEAGVDVDQAECVDYLRDVPLDMIQWTIDQRAREDLRLVRRPMIERWQVDRLLPPSERALQKWDANPFDAVAGEDARTENCATYWLLPYWMGRYLQAIGPAESDGETTPAGR